MKLIKAVFLGLVLTSFVLALPTDRERTELKEEQSELMGERREERRESNSVQLDRKDEERRETDPKDKDEERREVDRKEKERREKESRETMKKEEKRREKEEEKEEKRREKEEKKEKERRETEKKEKDEERREVDRKDKDEERREVDRKEKERREKEEKEEKERRETGDKKDKEERREVDRKNKDEERREVDRKEMERREAMKKEKEEKRREKEEEKEEMRREKEEKKEEKRREKEEKKEKERRGTDEMRKDAQRREAEKKDKDAERREVDRMDKDAERREVDRMDKDAERREVDRMEKDEERREVDNKKDEERRETMKKDEELRETEVEREKRRPTPAMEEKEAKRELMANMDQALLKEEKRENRETTETKRDTSVAICESVTDFKYFQKIENEPTKYIQCDPWGTGKVKTCPEGLLWNEWTLICDPKEKIHNMTLDLSKFSVTTASRPVVNCSLAGIECLNGGVCVQATTGDYKCSCRTDYTGQFCEGRVDFTDITHEILNSTFSVVDYRKHLQEENLTMSISYYEKFKDQLDNLTYTELIKYLSFYKDGEVRFDTLINSLVEDILENIYPDAEYLSVFNATQQNVVSMVQMIPSLLSYSRYSFERYEDVFAQYQHVLTTLSKSLNTTLPRINEEATQYTILTRIFLNQTASLMSSLQDHSLVENTPVDQPIQLSEADIKKALQYNYNETLKATEKLITILETFQNSVVKELETNPGAVVKLTLGEAKFPGAQDMLTVLNQVSTASSQIWESLVNYGFWYLTNLFSSADKVASIDKFAFNLNKF